MRYAFSLAAILTSLLAASAFAADGNVPQSTLDILGLADMETVSDEVGMQVRGMGAAAATRGHSHVFGFLVDPVTNSNIIGVDANFAGSALKKACCPSAGNVSHATASAVNVSLQITNCTKTFNQMLIGGAGGSASASLH